MCPPKTDADGASRESPVKWFGPVSIAIVNTNTFRHFSIELRVWRFAFDISASYKPDGFKSSDASSGGGGI